MKKWTSILLVIAMLCLTGCSRERQSDILPETTDASLVIATESPEDTGPVPEGTITDIVLNGDTVTVGAATATEEEAAVCLSRDIVYYEDRDTYESGNPYGNGTESDRHSAEEAAEHLVVNITQPGNYRLSGELTLGQIRIDLGDDAYSDPGAVVNLILDGVTINCTVAPAILFRNVYECDGDWSVETAGAEVDTTSAGANLILASGSRNVVNGSHVAKVYRDAEGEKKLVKQDGAIYSYMSMNVSGSGTLDLYADNEGLDTELHLTINGGNLNIRAEDDGINTNEDGVSVTTINGGTVHIIAGLGAEGDGIDSNGYLVINGGTVVASANPASDAGLDSDMGSYINGGTVIALGSTMDWAESDSNQVTMNLQFAQMQSSGSAIVVTDESGNYVFAYDPSEDEILGQNTRQYMGAIISCPDFQVDQTYLIYLDGTVTGTDVGGIYNTSTITAYEGGIQQAYTGTDVMRGGMGGFPGGERGEMPGDGSDGMPLPEGEMPTMPEGETPPQRPDGEEQQGGFDGKRPEDMTLPEGEMPTMPEGGFDGGEMPAGENFAAPGDRMPGESGEASCLFYMQDKVNFFSGVTAYTAQ